MKTSQNAIQLGALLTLVTIFGAAQAQSPHSLTYTQISVAPGTQVTIGGMDMVAVQTPGRQFTMDKRYAIRFLAPLFTGGEGDAVSGNIFIQHSDEPLQNANAMIDGIPARIDVQDGRTFGVNTLFPPPTFMATNYLQVESLATAIVTMKLGDALLIYVCSAYKSDHEVELGPNEYRGTSQAAYGRYTDPIYLINEVDKCIDYFRVIALN